jgi:type IV pilus assembly protein PilB
MYPSIDTIKQILLQENYISEEDSKMAEVAAHDSQSYVEFLIREELLSKTLLGQALAEAYKLPFADLNITPITKDAVIKIPEAEARANRAVFVKASDKVAAVASDQPQKVNLEALQRFFPSQKIRLAYTLPEYVDASLSLYERPLETRFSQIIGAGQRVAPEIVDEIIKDALVYRASDVHFEPQAGEVTIRFRVDGSLREAGKIPRENYENVLNRIKVESGMRIDEHFSAQDGSIQRQMDSHVVDMRVSLVPTVRGEKIVMRVLGSYVQNYTLTDIGLDSAHRSSLETYAAKPFGMILTVGPTGSGKTTTLYALVKLLNKANVNITSIEDPVEYKVQGVNQIQVREQSNLTFAKGLRSIVRQDPNIILVGEIRDRETAEISINAALTGHLLLSTFHANDAATAIPRLADMGIEPFLLASTLEVIIAQRLARKICEHCRYSLQAEEVLKELGPNASKAAPYFSKTDYLYAGKGCAVCTNTGYSGRVALFEFLQVTPDMQDLVMKSPSARDIEALARKQGDVSMFDDGIKKVKSGITTISEVMRVVEPPRVAAGAKGDGR